MGRTRAFAVAAALLLSLAVVPAARAAVCPTAVDASGFPSEAKLQRLLAKEMSFGDRYLASPSHEGLLEWIEGKVRRIDGFTVRSDPFKVYRWLPRTEAKDRPGFDIGRAARLTVTGADGATERLPVAGAVHWTQPTSKQGRTGPLVYLGPEEGISAENAAGKVVIREFPGTSIPSVGLLLVADYITSDLLGDLSQPSYERPFLHEMHQELLAAGEAGAAGVIFTFNVPREQVRGYADPHTGTLYSLPAAFAGDAEAAQLKALAAQGASASLAVRAKVDRAKTRNLIATLPGQSPERMVLSTNTDGQSWVQENGVVGLLALAGYYADLPMECRPRTLVLAFGSAHDALISEGTERYAVKLDPQYDQGTVAFAFAIEHLGTREILPAPDPDGSGERLVFTGNGETFLFGVGDSPTLRQTAVAATQGRGLDRTAVLRGLGLPEFGRLPPVCSMGGIGTIFHRHLIPTLAMISGPWSLYGPSFGESAIDFARMRNQLLAAGDAVLALDGLPREQIAGDYLAFREQRAAGGRTCPPEVYPQFGPGPAG